MNEEHHAISQMVKHHLHILKEARDGTLILEGELLDREIQELRVALEFITLMEKENLHHRAMLRTVEREIAENQVSKLSKEQVQ